jgi:hypothetical protein
MLSRKDKAEIQKMIQEEFKAALFREITVEKNNPNPMGDVPGRRETSTANLLDMLVISVPRWVQSIAGAEAASNQARNRSNEALKRVGDLESTILAVADSIQIMARFAVALRDTGLLEQLESVSQIDHDDIRKIEHESNTG